MICILQNEYCIKTSNNVDTDSHGSTDSNIAYSRCCKCRFYTIFENKIFYLTFKNKNENEKDQHSVLDI